MTQTPETRTRAPIGRRLVLAALLLLALAAAGGLAWLSLRPLPVRTGQVERGEAVEAVYASGVVEYVRQARVAPVVSAPILRVLAEEGQAVAAGQVLAQLDDGPQMGTTLQLEAQAAQARAAERRVRRLSEAGFAAPAALEDAVSQLRAAEAAAQSARARQSDYRIRAPFAGRVLRREAEPGDLAQTGTPMFVIADPADLRITADIDERDIGRLAPGQEAVLKSDAFPGQTFPSRLTELTPQGDAASRVFRARLAVPTGTPLRPGMTVEANLVVARRAAALLAPTEALSDGRVWVVREGRAHARPVTTGARGVKRTEVLEGLGAGERVILSPPARLKEGARVTAAPDAGR